MTVTAVSETGVMCMSGNRQLVHVVPMCEPGFLISDTSARAMRAYHEINCDVGNLKVTLRLKTARQLCLLVL